MAAEPFDTVLVVDFGAQYAQLIARRVRECRVFSEIVPSTMPVEQMLAKRPKAIILSGGPSSVYAPGAPQVGAELFTAGVPTFGICYGFQAMARALGGEVRQTGRSEFGHTLLRVREPRSALFTGLPAEQSVWMSHGDSVWSAPEGFVVTADSDGAHVAAFEDVERGLAGVQFHPEVVHTPHGQKVLEHFLYDLAGCRPTWTMVNIVEEQVERVRAQIGGKRAICGLSGGVDSAVAAALVQRAIGDRLTCVFVDHGLLRKGEAEQVERDFVASTGVQLKVVDASQRFLDALAGLDRSGGQTQGDRARVHPRLRAGRARGGGRVRGARRVGRVPRAGHALPRRRRVRRWRGCRQHQVPPQRRRAAGRPAVLPRRAAARRCSRTRYAGSARSSACPPRSCGGSRSPGPAWRSASSAR